MSRNLSRVFSVAVVAFVGCANSGYAVRSVPRIAAETVGKPVSRLQEAFGDPRKVDTMPNRQIYVWFLPASPPGAPAGLHGCEMEVTVEPRSQQVLGYSMTSIGWSKCGEVARRIRIT